VRWLLACLLLAVVSFLSAERAAAVAPPVVRRFDAHGDPLPRQAVARLGTGRFRLGVGATGLTLSPDGRTLAAFSNSRDQVVLWDAVTGKEVRRLDLDPSGRHLHFTPDGKELIASDYDGTVHVFDPGTGKELRRVSIRPADGEVIAVSGDGRLLAASGSASRRRSPVLVFEIGTGKQLARVELPSAGQVGLALSPDGKYLATWSSESSPGGPRFGRGGRFGDEPARTLQAVQLWGPAAGKEAGKIATGSTDSISAVAFAPDRKTLAVASSTGSVQLWDVAAGKRLRSWQGPAQRGGRGEGYLLFSSNGKRLLLGERGTEAAPAAWDLGSGRRLRVARAPQCLFQGAAFPANGRIIAFGLRAQTVVLWDLLTGKQLGDSEGHTSAVTALTFRRDGRHLFSVAADQRVLEWDRAGKVVRYLPQPRLALPPFRRPPRFQAGSQGGVFSPGGAYLAADRPFAGLSVRDVETAQDVFTVPRSSTRLSSSPSAVAFSPDGKLFAVPSVDAKRNGIVRLIQVESGDDLPAYEVAGSAASSLAFAPDAKRLAVVLSPPLGQAGEGREVRLWRLDLKREDPDFRPILLPGSFRGVPLAFAPDGSLLAAADTLGAVFLFSARTGRQVGQLGSGGVISRGPVFSPDGRCLAVATSQPDQAGPRLALWEMSTGKRRWSALLPAAATALAFSPTGQVLATGHADSTTLLWDVTGRLTERPVAPRRLEGLWQSLAAPDPEKAFQAQRLLAAGGSRTVALLRKRLRPAAGRALGADTLARLVKQLDDDEFTVRRRAFETLAGQGKAAEPQLRKALEGKPSIEVRRRVNELLARLDRLGVAAGEERPLRALEVLEWIGSPAARKLVEELARGQRDAPLTSQARAALKRLPRQRE
jgi:WD40 repeat protein